MLGVQLCSLAGVVRNVVQVTLGGMSVVSR